MQLVLKLRHEGTEVASAVEGGNIAEIMVQMPELLNEMVRHMSTRQETPGVTYERKDC